MKKKLSECSWPDSLSKLPWRFGFPPCGSEHPDSRRRSRSGGGNEKSLISYFSPLEVLKGKATKTGLRKEVLICDDCTRGGRRISYQFNRCVTNAELVSSFWREVNGVEPPESDLEDHRRIAGETQHLAIHNRHNRILIIGADAIPIIPSLLLPNILCECYLHRILHLHSQQSNVRLIPKRVICFPTHRSLQAHL
ncbi:hypothetical protein VNO77_18975 [Canavalia gladiata]|uniref:Uncharacterized protein n=1 Tax=Canavalia gladiata TaxID=3824 RepID=A0AAN9LQI3_CANGL